MNFKTFLPQSVVCELLCCTLTTIALGLTSSEAQTLEELKQLPAYQKLDAQTGRSHSSVAQPSSTINRDTNFGSLWLSSRSPSNLLSWLQAKLPEYGYMDSSGGLHDEYAGAQAVLVSKQHVRVRIDILIPRAEYATMAQFNTLKSFNQFRPPTLDVIAEQIVPIQGIDANYYRTEKGQCSLLFKVERLGIVNLKTDRCADSKVMIDIAKKLNFARLNQKLLS